MEAKYENSTLLRTEILNTMIALVQSIGFNLYETVKDIKVVVERQDGSFVTERLTEEEIRQTVDAYIAEHNKIPEATMKRILDYIIAQQKR